jgi:hypothetical protein
VRQPCDRDLEIGQALREVMCRGLTVDSGIGRHDHLAHGADLRALHEARDVELVGPDAVERREGAAQHVIAAGEDLAALHRPQVGHVLDDADQPGVAPWIATDRAGVDGVEVAAGRARLDGERGIGQRGAERLHQRLALLQKVQRDPSRRTWPEAGQAAQQLDQPLDFRADHGRSG